ncbi:MAG TPA: septum formation initiator family protein [Candidatus Tumulicola sp.]|nr:septum formation initiator family protein [Candidatus Tumulicola sp.]
MKRRIQARPILRLLGRCTASALGLVVFTLVAIQFGRVFAQDLGARHELSSIRQQIAQLQKRRTQQQAEIRRLRSPQGAIPEIHDRLRMVRPNEELIFVSPAPPPQP